MEESAYKILLVVCSLHSRSDLVTVAYNGRACNPSQLELYVPYSRWL